MIPKSVKRFRKRSCSNEKANAFGMPHGNAAARFQAPPDIFVTVRPLTAQTGSIPYRIS
jgi:hypothetical protein